ncbi:MAG: ABC-F type ribosomal protection protein [Eubacterium sp.]|nr:ABC-F type ribosomal protection protein [Eubacterium sp.]
MLLSCNHIYKAFGERTVLNDASFHINDREKYALVGENGAGKSTLLKMIVGEEPADKGEIILSNGVRTGYLPQQLGYHSDKTIFEELYAVRSDLLEQERVLGELELKIADISDTDKPSQSGTQDETYEALLERYHRLQTDFELKDGYSYKARVLGIIDGLGFGGDRMNQVINELSGGQKTRVALGKLLIEAPDLLILDEPTNHLDISSVSWLEKFISSFAGAVLVVSHDRYFLDRFTEHVIEIDNGTLRSYKGDYTSYTAKKEILDTALLHAYEKQQLEIKHQEKVIEKLRQFNREKSIKRARSREKLLDKMEKAEKPVMQKKSMHVSFEAAIKSGNDVLGINALKKSFDGLTLFHDASFEIKRGEKVVIIGDNGTGKTTLLHMINGTETIDEGTITIGTGVETGYYDQEHGILHDEKTLFDELHDDYPYLDNTEIRNTLAAFLFIGDDVFKNVGSLSGGEKGRLSLAKLMLSEANLLLLDEPTNHLDMVSLEILETALNEFDGTLLCVSHDRYFINKVATRVIELKNGRFYDFLGNYDYYLEKRDTMYANDSIKNSSPGAVSSTFSDNTAQKKNAGETDTGSSKDKWLADKERETNKRRLQKEYDEAENTIDRLENELKEIDELLMDPDICRDIDRLKELDEKRNKTDTALMEAMSEWERIGEELEAI